jgi:hypothetical protein
MLNTSKLKILMVGAIYALVIGCATTSTTTSNPLASIGKVKGVDVEKLAGKWEGEYTSSITQRSGAVIFDLTKTSSGHALGRITKTEYVTSTTKEKRGATHKSIGPKHKTVPVTKTSKQETPLSIDFMGLEGDKISGEVTPHYDPKFNATVFTTYEATLKDNRMEGTFTTRIGQNGNSYTGSWWTIRK